MADISDQVAGESSAGNEDEKLLEEAKSRFKLCVEAESEIRSAALEDIKFALGDQWSQEDLRSRKIDGRPSLVINKTQQQVNQITNDQRQNRPSIKVSPVDDKADIETAKIRQGLIRHIEYDSNADIAYSNAFEFAVTGGFGFMRVVTEYANPLSFRRQLRIKQVKNPFSAYLDPNHKEPDGSDAEYGFVFEDYSEDQYKRMFPKSKLAQKGEWEAVGAQMPEWMPKGYARVAEYFYKKYVPANLLLLSTGEEVLENEINRDALPPEIQVLDERETMVPEIRWVKFNGCELLGDKTTFPGQYIPIIPAYGKVVEVDGKKVVKGIVRDSKDPAKMYNYFASAEAEMVALAPRAPFILDPKQIAGFENIWRTANKRNYSYLPVHSKDDKGQPMPFPQRSTADLSTAAITQGRMLASDDLKAATGIYDASLGNKSNETSGVAIQRRNAQANTANFHFIDNLNKSIRHVGRILNDAIPSIYDTAQSARIIGEEGDERVVRINDPEFIEKGKDKPYMLDVGKYDVTIDTGPSFQTKRQEAVASMLEVARAYPQIMQVAGDIFVKNQDWPGAQEFSERIKKTIPPEILGDNKDDKGKQIPPEVQAQMQHMGQMIEQLTEQLNVARSPLELKRMEIESRERIATMELETKAAIELAKLQSGEATALLAHQTRELDARSKQLGATQPFPGDEPQPTLSPEPMDGGVSAGPEFGQDPTGGESPGLPVEEF